MSTKEIIDNETAQAKPSEEVYHQPWFTSLLQPQEQPTQPRQPRPSPFPQPKESPSPRKKSADPSPFPQPKESPSPRKKPFDPSPFPQSKESSSPRKKPVDPSPFPQPKELSSPHKQPVDPSPFPQPQESPSPRKQPCPSPQSQQGQPHVPHQYEPDCQNPPPLTSYDGESMAKQRPKPSGMKKRPSIASLAPSLDSSIESSTLIPSSNSGFQHGDVKATPEPAASYISLASPSPEPTIRRPRSLSLKSITSDSSEPAIPDRAKLPTIGSSAFSPENRVAHSSLSGLDSKPLENAPNVSRPGRPLSIPGGLPKQLNGIPATPFIPFTSDLPHAPYIPFTDGLYSSKVTPSRPAQDRRGELLTILRGFSKQISRHIQVVTSPSPSASSNSLRQDVHAAYRRFRMEVHKTAPRFRPWEASFRPQDHILRTMIEKIESDDAPGGVGAVMYIDDVMNAINRCRIDDPLGGVPFSVKESLVKESIKGWKYLAEECSAELQEMLYTHLNGVLVSDIGPAASNEELLRRIRDILNTELQNSRNSMEERIDFLYAAEQQVFTQNDQLYMEYRAKWLDRYGVLLKQSREGGMAELLNRYTSPKVENEYLPYGGTLSVSKASGTKSKIDSLIEEFAALGVHIQVSDLAKLFPADPMDPAVQLIAEVRAYFEVAYKRFSDAVPQQLHLTFLRGFDDSMDLALSRFAMGLNPDECAELLSSGR